MPSLNRYLKLLKKNTTPFPCPHCHQSIEAEFFEEHCLVHHALDPDVACVWCFGHTFWVEKNHHVDHLLSCYHQFFQSQVCPLILSPQPDTPTLLDLEPLCEEKQFEHHIPLPSLPETPVWELEPPLKGIPFQCARLNVAVACVQLYLNSSADWYHICVRPPAFDSFQKALDADAGKTRTLPFHCFCDGGGVPHRHFVLMSTPKGSFLKKTWKKMKSPSIQKDVISSPLMLVHVLVALSQRLSQCHFTTYPLDPSFLPVGSVTQYYIAKSLPAFSKLVLALQWKGGLMTLLHQVYAAAEPHVLAPVTLSMNGLLAVRVHDLPGLLKNWILPVSLRFRPTTHPTHYFVHLYQNQKLYFESCEEPLLNWQQEQVEHGNVFCDALGEAFYFPTPMQQKTIHLLKPLMDQLLLSQEKMQQAEKTRHRVETDLAHVKKLHAFAKRKYSRSEKQLKTVQSKLISYLERENDELRKKCFKKPKIN